MGATAVYATVHHWAVVIPAALLIGAVVGLGRSPCAHPGTMDRVTRHPQANRAVPKNLLFTFIGCPLRVGSSVHHTGGDRHSEERNEDIDDQQDLHDTVRY
jgi:hypothetical protein